MKTFFILAGLILSCSLSGCSNKTAIQDIEAYCASFGEICPQNENRCEFCGATKTSSYASCHSKEFCKNAPMIDND